MSLISEFGFNEGSGLITYDPSGYHLTASNTATSWGPGRQGSGAAQQFKGFLGPSGSLSQWTVMFWLKIPALPSNSAGLVYQPLGNPGEAFYLSIDNSGMLTNWTNTAPINSAGTIPVDVWTHVAVTWGNSGTTTMYINAIADASGPYGVGVSFGQPGYTWYVAADSSRYPVGFDGVIDDLRLFDTEMSAGEIATWMNTPVVGVNAPPVEQTALIAEYDFNEGSGTTTADLTGNGYDLTTSGSGWVSGGYNSPYSGKADFSGVVGPNVLQESWTVMAWVKWNAKTVPYMAILSNGSNFYFELWRDGTSIECYSGVSGHPSSEPSIIPSGTWAHVAATRYPDGTSIVFVNGQPIVTGKGNPANFGAGTWYVGGANNPSYVLDGSVDTLRIFDDALDSESIRAWMHTPYGCKPPTLLAAYAFNEADGATTILDYSGNNVAATANGVSFTDGPLTGTRAVTFTNTGQSVQISRVGTEPATKGVTAMCWAKGPVDMDYLVKSRDGGGSTRIGVGPNWRARWKDDLHFTDGGSGADTSVWHHYCVIDADDEWVILIDGAYYTGGSRSFTSATPASWEDYPWCIGQTPNTALGDSRSGQTVAEVRIFQGAMYSEPQVQYYMNTPVSPQGRKFYLSGKTRPLKLGNSEKLFKSI